MDMAMVDGFLYLNNFALKMALERAIFYWQKKARLLL